MKSKVKTEVLCIENKMKRRRRKKNRTRNSVHIKHACVEHIGNSKRISMQIHQNRSRIAILLLSLAR